MKSKIIKILISYLITEVIFLIFSQSLFLDLGILDAHSGLLFVFGLLFGPYGALGAVLGDLTIDIFTGFDDPQFLTIHFISAIVSFSVSYLAYKLWYTEFITKKITKPKLDNIYHLMLFLSSILICGLIFSGVHAIMEGIFFGPAYDELFFVSYFMNFINIAFITGILGIWICNKIDFVETPKISKRPLNKKLYRILFYLLLLVSILSTASLVLNLGTNISIVEIALIMILLIAYLTKPFKNEIKESAKNTIVENVIRNFLIISLIITVLGVIFSILSYDYIMTLPKASIYLLFIPALIISDTILILFFIPGIIILRYIENKVLKPISSFSEIEEFIKENEKIESEGLVEIYSKYISEQNEIGTLARSYTDLINHNNNYIENIHEIQGEKERIKAELDIATKIQAENLPVRAIENESFTVNGYSHPAKEVGGDFFDYYMLDEDNLAIVIGDASGKGVPAALIAMITQVRLKEMLDHVQNPAEVLYRLNNQLNENNSEAMFLTLWLGIYNRKNKKLTYSNAGHNPPLIKKNNKFEYLNIDAGIVLGIMEDYEYEKEEILLDDEIILYTDGITDANNIDNEMYSEERLLNFMNRFKSNNDLIRPLLNDISRFTKGAEQYDDMTLVYLKIKND